MSDTFSYNSITISNPLVDTISADSLYDDAEASVVYTKILYRVTGTIQGSSAADFQSKLATARKGLLVPRCTLQVNMGGTDIFNQNYDYKTGPLPRSVKFTEIVGAIFCFVAFEIEVDMQEKCATDAGTWVIISSSYSVTHTIDEACYTTRTVRGKVRVKSFASGAANNPDASLRSLVTPNLPSDFRRERMDFGLSADGLELSYEIVDRELYRSPPKSAVKAAGKFSHRTDNYLYFNHISLELVGSKDSKKVDMMNDIFTMAASRVDLTLSKETVVHAMLEEDLYENAIHFELTTTYTEDPGDEWTPFPKGTKIFTIPQGDNHQVKSLGPYGSAWLAAGKTIFFNACKEDPSQVRFAQFKGQGNQPTLSSGGVSVTDNAPTADATSVLSGAQKISPYIHWENYISYEQDNGCEVLPSTKAGTPGKVYQWYVPYQIVRQRGCAIRSNAPVIVPPPQVVSMDGNPLQGTLRRKSVIPGSPQLQPDKKSYQFSASWEYEILVPLAATNLQVSGKLVDVNTGALPQPVNNAATFDPTTSATKIAKVPTPITITS